MPIRGEYSWSERSENLTVRIPLKGVAPSKVDIFVTSQLVKVNYAPYLIEVLLHGRIDDKKHKASVKDGVLIMTLVKTEPGKWGQLEAEDVENMNRQAFAAKKKDALVDHAKVEEQSQLDRKDRKHKDEKFALRKQMGIDSGQRDRLDRVKAEEKSSEEAAMYATFAKMNHEKEVKEQIEASKKKEKKDKDEEKKKKTVAAAGGAGGGSKSIFDVDTLPKESALNKRSEKKERAEKVMELGDSGGKVIDLAEIDTDSDSDSDSEKNKDDEETEVEDDEDDDVRYIPAPRSAGEDGKVNIRFTPRHFPTPMRESQASQEEDWIAKNRKHLKKHGILAQAAKGTKIDGQDVSEEDPSWLKGKGDDFFRGGDIKSAINAYCAALDVDEGFLACFSNRAACYLKLGQLDDCISDCSEALRLYEATAVGERPAATTKVRLLLRRGAARCNLGKYDDAGADYRLGSKVLAADVEGDAGVAMAAQIKRDLVVLDKLVKTDALKRMADKEFAEGNIQSAAGVYSEALSVVSIHVGCISNRSACKLAAGDLAGCIDDCSVALSVLELSVDDHSGGLNMLNAILPPAGSAKRKEWVMKTVLRRGAAHAQGQDWVSAVADYSMAVGLDPENLALKSDLNKLRTSMEAQKQGFLPTGDVTEKNGGGAQLGTSVEATDTAPF